MNVFQILLKNDIAAMPFSNQLVCFFEAFYGGNNILFILRVWNK